MDLEALAKAAAKQREEAIYKSVAPLCSKGPVVFAECKPLSREELQAIIKHYERR